MDQAGWRNKLRCVISGEVRELAIENGNDAAEGMGTCRPGHSFAACLLGKLCSRRGNFKNGEGGGGLVHEDPVPLVALISGTPLPPKLTLPM